MTTNYRSTASIIARSNALIACNYANPGRAGRLPKALTAAPGTVCNEDVQFVRYRSKESQGKHILESLQWWHKHGRCTRRFKVLSVCLPAYLSACLSVTLSPPPHPSPPHPPKPLPQPV